ncbi:MAG: BrnA antitoxin family protein [Pseudomonadota bacterium]
MKKQLPKLANDKEAEDFIDSIDLTQYDLSKMQQVHFEFQPKDKSITLRLPESLLTTIKSQAMQSGIPYQRFIREALENVVHCNK